MVVRAFHGLQLLALKKTVGVLSIGSKLALWKCMGSQCALDNFAKSPYHRRLEPTSLRVFTDEMLD